MTISYRALLQRRLLVIIAVWCSIVGVCANAESLLGPAKNYLLHCEGCHMADGSGQPGYVPAFRYSVSRFLAIPEGRAYLGRVPGTSQSLLADSDRAELLNWIVSKFDADHLPVGFRPYTADELSRYRRDPVSQASVERARILSQIASIETSSPGGSSVVPIFEDSKSQDSEISPPPQFAICAACHPSSNDGASAMGPNLRGILGRRAAALENFSYSAAMKGSNIIWTRQELDEYLENGASKVPGNMMTFSGISDPTIRASVIDYLENLK